MSARPRSVPLSANKSNITAASGKAAKEDDLYIFGEGMVVQKPALSFKPLERRIPFDHFVNVRNRLLDERIQPGKAAI